MQNLKEMKFNLTLLQIFLTLVLSAQTYYDPTKKLKPPPHPGNLAATSFDSVDTKKLLTGYIVYINF